MPGLRKAEIRKQARLLDDFFKVDEVFVAHQQLNGEMSADQRRLVFERGDAVAVLLYNSDTHKVVLVNQFKVPAMIARRRDNPSTVDGWITETIAGMIDKNESPEEAAVRETMEETGYKIRDPELICKFFSSPGGTSERIFLYFASVKASDRVGKGGGVRDEDVAVLHVPVTELFDQLAKGQIEDPKLAIAADWLQGHLRRVKALDHSTVRYHVVHKPGAIVGYKTGDIADVKDVSIWVNSENTDMMMDRFLGKTISAKIRWLGANKDDDGNVTEDTIQESLRDVMGERAHVRIGNVLVTKAGMLWSTHGVQRIFHVATVEGGPGQGVSAKPDKLRTCVKEVLARVDRENRTLRRIICKNNLDSILFPLLGTGDGGQPVESVVDNLILEAVGYFGGQEKRTLKEIYFLAFKAPERSACEEVLQRFCRERILAPVGRTHD
jgi:nudix-type nucleoside diphosphatase (YffH/AdpP family)